MMADDAQRAAALYRPFTLQRTCAT